MTTATTNGHQRHHGTDGLYGRYEPNLAGRSDALPQVHGAPEDALNDYVGMLIDQLNDLRAEEARSGANIEKWAAKLEEAAGLLREQQLGSLAAQAIRDAARELLPGDRVRGQVLRSQLEHALERLYRQGRADVTGPEEIQ